MQIVVASRNPVKLAATRHAFATQFPDATLEIIAVDVDSGAGDQPFSDEATRHGARTRARRAQAQAPDADFWVGLEGGIETVDDRLMAFAWMAVQGPASGASEARSTTLPLPPAVKALVDDGMELGEANDRVFATMNSKQAVWLADRRALHPREHLQPNVDNCVDSVCQRTVSTGTRAESASTRKRLSLRVSICTDLVTPRPAHGCG
jgi:inosine/xanthosine triphosphatase